MRSFWGRFLRHMAGVGITLAVIGYLLGKGFLMANQMSSGDGHNPDNDRVLWQTPLVMAIMGMFLCGGIDLLAAMIRRPAAVKVGTSSGPDSV